MPVIPARSPRPFQPAPVCGSHGCTFEVRDSEGQLLDRVEPGGYSGLPLSVLTGDAILTDRLTVIEGWTGLPASTGTVSGVALCPVDRFDRFLSSRMPAVCASVRAGFRGNRVINTIVGLATICSRQPVVALAGQAVAEV